MIFGFKFIAPVRAIAIFITQTPANRFVDFIFIRTSEIVGIFRTIDSSFANSSDWL